MAEGGGGRGGRWPRGEVAEGGGALTLYPLTLVPDPSELSSVVLTANQIAQREKQVMYGKVTEGYQNYKAIIPK